jgi:hypothetical protein
MIHPKNNAEWRGCGWRSAGKSGAPLNVFKHAAILASPTVGIGPTCAFTQGRSLASLWSPAFSAGVAVVTRLEMAGRDFGLFRKSLPHLVSFIAEHSRRVEDIRV